MDFTSLKIFTKTGAIEILTHYLMEIGITGFVVEDSDDFNGFLEEDSKHWDYIDDSLMSLKNNETNITVYLPKNSQGSEQYFAIQKLIKSLEIRKDVDFGRLEIETDDVFETDWANNWKQYFKPLRIGEKFIVKPSWEELDEDNTLKVIEIDPNSSFGTGQHNTTRLCLSEIEKIVKTGDKVLDMGCGSGILAIASALLGAESVTGVDIELNSVDTTRENFIKNNIDISIFTGYCGDVISNKEIDNALKENQVDVISANIVADVIIAMSKNLFTYLKDSGTIIVSGIISNREDEVKKILMNTGFNYKSRNEQDDWVAMTFTK